MSAALENLATVGEFARLAGYKPSYISQLKADGRLVLAEDGRKICVAESLALIQQTRDPSKAAVAARHAASRAASAMPTAASEPDLADEPEETPEPSNSGGSEYQKNRAMREGYLALSAKRDYEQSMGNLLDAAAVESVVAAAVNQFRAALEALPDLLAPQVIAAVDEPAAKNLIAEAIEYRLHELERQFKAVAKAEPA